MKIMKKKKYRSQAKNKQEKKKVTIQQSKNNFWGKFKICFKLQFLKTI